MKTLLTLITVIALMLAIQVYGSARYDEWQWMAGELYIQDKSNTVCRHRCALIAKRMIENGKSFDLVFGTTPTAKRHVRIEYWKDYEFVILEPSWSDSATYKFIEDDRWSYIPNEDANIRVISWVNRVLLELGERPTD